MRELIARGHEVVRVVRPSTRGSGILWDPRTGQIESEKLEGLDGVVHLAGESIATWWTPRRKRRILDSRALGTSLMATSLARLTRPPPVLLCASAIGYYGNRPASEEIDETTAPGSGFLADVVKIWESSASPARDAGIRVVHTRFGLVLAKRGGALKFALPVFYAGLGGRLGSGRQIWSWVSIDDVASSVLHALETNVEGPINVTAPNPVSNNEFTKALAQVMHRPAVFHVPEFLLRLGGEMVEETILSGARVVPRKLLQSGYRFRYPDLRQALQAILA